MAIKPLKVSHFTVTNALGRGNAASLQALQQQQTGLVKNNFLDSDLDTYIGRVAGIDSSIDGDTDDAGDIVLPSHLSKFNCRNNRLAYLGLQQDNFSESILAAREKYGADRVAVFLGTSTSGIQQSEMAYATLASEQKFPDDYLYTKTHNNFSLADFVQNYFELTGLAHVVSTACSSSAKVFATAYRHMQAGFCDAVIVGGVDSLCKTTLYGFNSLQLISSQKCTPWGKDRMGINIGEGAGFALLEWQEADTSETYKPEQSSSKSKQGDIVLLGYGESSDAYHMSTPHPEGRGAAQAMQAALDSANLEASDIDYINLHGTATQSNDNAEDKAVITVFGNQTPASSTKGWTGHTLGAAGITEVIFGCLALQNNFIPVNLNTSEVDPSTNANIILEEKNMPVNTFLSNSFGFGGSNCSLLFGKQSR